MAPRAEKRADPDDGTKYTWEEFQEFYGAKKGQKKWDAAGVAKGGGKVGGGAEKQCTVCGNTNHLKADCKHKEKECSSCGKVGHLASVCWAAGAAGGEAAAAPKAKAKVKAKAKAKAQEPRKPKVDAELLEAAIAGARAQPAKCLELVAPVPTGMPQATDFKVVEKIVGEVEEGGILVEVICISADPYMRSKIKAVGGAKEGMPISGFITGRVLESKSPKWFPGDFIGASLPYTTVQVVTKEMLEGTVSWKLTGLVTEATASLGIGILGMPGSTAYGGFFDILKPKRAKTKGEPNGETIFVSAASGAVGQLVGQLAKLSGCVVVGSAGGPAKCAVLKEKFGYDHTIDYKTCSTAEELKAKLKECAPEGIDMYFENVGGIHFDAALASIKPGGRIAVCGCISQYNEGGEEGGGLGGDSNKLFLGNLVYPQIRIEGFMCSRWLSGQKGTFLRDMHRYLKSGKLETTETVTEGIENWPAAFQSLFTGANNGKVVVKVADPKPLRAEKKEEQKEEKKKEDTKEE